MKLLISLIQQLFGKPKSAQTAPIASKAVDDQEGGSKKYDEVLPKNTKYVYRMPTSQEVLTWSGKGRRPKWIHEYLAGGGDLDDIEYPAKQIIRTAQFIIKVSKNLKLTNGPHGSFAHKSIKDIKGNLWIESDRTLYDYDGVYVIPMEVLTALKAEGFNTQSMEDDHVNNDLA